jgi:P-aminobenzoate N-oxygenase AurF
VEQPVRRLSKLLPDLEDDLLLNLFHRGAKVQWTSRDLDWAPPMRLTDRQREALARLLTPVYFGEQTAMIGASGILPQVAAAGETSAQLYLTSFVMDEARHFEALTRLFRKLGHDPLGLRQMPELLRYHHRIRQGDRADWVWGILFSDVIAKHFYRSFGVAQADPLFGEMSKHILLDESRHLAFADHYLRRNVPRMEPARRRALVDMRDDLFRLLRSMTERVRADAAAFGVDADDYLARVWADVEQSGRRIGLDGGGEPPTPAGSAPGESPPGPEPEPEPPPSRSFAVSLPRCFGCLLTLLCGRRLVPA